jgi:glutamate/tyrosine decarboxylase-like PLP-dependent enzyme
VKNRLQELEQVARRLDPDAAQRAEWRRAVDAHVEGFLARLQDAPAFVPDYGTREGPLARPFREDPTRIDDVLALLAKEVERHGVNPTSPRSFGYIPGGGIYAAALGDYLADVINRYAGVLFASPGAARLERHVVSWLAGVIGYPAESAGGDLTSGGSIANLSAIVTARECHDIRAADIGRRVIYFTAHAHHSVHKALRIAGLAECVQRTVAMDGLGRMDVAELARCVAAHRQAGLLPWMVVANAGSTDIGAIDPLEGIGELCRAEDLWLHVDAAYGGAFVLCETGRKALAGIERSDSAVIDPHKGFFLPFGSGAVLVRERGLLAAAHHYRANYMQDAVDPEGELSPADLSPEFTRPFRAMRLWLPLQLYGLAPFRAALEEKLLLARYFHDRLSAVKGFEVGPPPELSVVTYRYLPRRGDEDAFNRKLVEAVQRDGRVFISSTLLNGRFTLRLAVLHFRTHLDEVDLAIDVLQHYARKLERE